MVKRCLLGSISEYIARRPSSRVSKVPHTYPQSREQRRLSSYTEAHQPARLLLIGCSVTGEALLKRLQLNWQPVITEHDDAMLAN